MAHSNKETLSIIWCDNGTTDGKFTEGLVYTLIHAPVVGVPVNNAIRVQGNQIARQRQAAIEMWQKVGTDWALWVDSDIVITQEMLKTLWDTADKVARPVVSGVYFISNNAGMGLVLMHKSVLKALNEKFPDDFWFGENNEKGDKFIGEDIAFFRKVRQSGIPIYAHTGVIPKHMKRFAFDDAYYNLYWGAVELAERRERESAEEQQA